MKLLFDTHAFIWWVNASTNLPERVLALCKEPTNTLWLSVASIWEMQIKLNLGKIKLQAPLAEVIDNQRRINRIEILPIVLEHVLALDTLPNHHKDPFDRLLVAQTSVEGATLISNDPLIQKYSAPLIW
jgi:PIN domain nuclease of toxin-antitoxin system